MIQTREIEVKYRVADAADMELALATGSLVLSTPVHQDDQAYAPYGWSYGMSKQGVPFARLRTQDGRQLFTLKRPTDNELACLEFETEVADRDQMHEAVVHMGFYPTVRIVKTRRTARPEMTGVEFLVWTHQLHPGPGRALLLEGFNRRETEQVSQATALEQIDTWIFSRGSR